MLFRFEGNYPWFNGDATKLPNGLLPGAVDEYLEPTEVQSRMSKVLHTFRLVDLYSMDWKASFEELGLDSLEVTAVLTSVEHEFHTVFEDRVFENFKSFDEVKRFIAADHNCF